MRTGSNGKYVEMDHRATTHMANTAQDTAAAKKQRVIAKAQRVTTRAARVTAKVPKVIAKVPKVTARVAKAIGRAVKEPKAVKEADLVRFLK